MPDTFTYMIFGYGVLVGGLMIYAVTLGIRQYLLEQKKKSLEEDLSCSEEIRPEIK